MKTKLHCPFLVLALLAGLHQVAAQGTRFFRITGPAATTITAFNPDGTLVWSNAQPGATYTIQTISALPGETNWVDYVQIPTTSGVNTNLLIDFNPPAGMVLIPAGSFTMGNSIGDYDINSAATVIANVSAFYMDKNLVSYSQWRSVYLWAKTNGYGFVNPGSGKAANHPVQTVNWYDAVWWCNARSQQAGLTPVYYKDAGLTQVYTNAQTTNVFANWTATGYRLPTEAEWEKAARGGLSGQRFPWGNVIAESLANYFGDPANVFYDSGRKGYNATYATGGFPYTSPVGSFAPNGYGLYDMAGNVLEWCWDRFGTSYAGDSDPRGPTVGSFRVMRGGNCDLGASESRCAYRNPSVPSLLRDTFGFRCVRGL